MSPSKTSSDSFQERVNGTHLLTADLTDLMAMVALTALIKSLGARFKILGYNRIKDYKGAHGMYLNTTINSSRIKCKYLSLQYSYLYRIILMVTTIILNTSNCQTIKWLTRASECQCLNKYRGLPNKHACQLKNLKWDPNQLIWFSKEIKGSTSKS